MWGLPFRGCQSFQSQRFLQKNNSVTRHVYVMGSGWLQELSKGNDAWCRSWSQLIRHGWTIQPIVSWKIYCFYYLCLHFCICEQHLLNNLPCSLCWWELSLQESGILFFPVFFQTCSDKAISKHEAILYMKSRAFYWVFLKRRHEVNRYQRARRVVQGRKHWGRCAWLVNA